LTAAGCEPADIGGSVSDVQPDPLPAAQAVRISDHAVEQYQQRIKPGFDLDAAQAELEKLRTVAQIAASAPEWVNAVRQAPCYLLIGDAIVLPVLRDRNGWVATTCLIDRTITPARRQAKTARKASLGSAKRAQRRARS
jgi:hypothetical protein